MLLRYDSRRYVQIAAKIHHTAMPVRTLSGIKIQTVLALHYSAVGQHKLSCELFPSLERAEAEATLVKAAGFNSKSNCLRRIDKGFFRSVFQRRFFCSIIMSTGPSVKIELYFLFFFMGPSP